MIYQFTLQTAGFLAGALLILSHGFALWQGEIVRKLLAGFPRSRAAGTVLLVIAAIWGTWLVATMDLGEFTKFEKPLLIGLPIAAILAWKFVDEFLAVRSLGMLALLAAEPLLEAAFLRPEPTRLALVILAYAWAILGMFWVGSPYLLRDQIGWVSANPSRWTAACAAGFAYGVLLCGLAVTW